MNLMNEIELICDRNHINYLGIAPGSRLENAPEGHRPTDFLANSKVVIVLGIRIGKGSVAAHQIAYSDHKMRHAIYPYLLFGYGLLDHILASACFEISLLLENFGYTTLSIPPSMPNDPLTLRGAMSHKHAAVAAGLGEFGWTTLLLTPEGSQLRLASIITEAELQSSPLYNGPSLCNPKECKFLCARICPMNAIPVKEAVECRIGEKTFRYGKLDKWSCRWGQHGFTDANLGRKNIPKPDIVTKESYLEALKQVDPWQAKEQSPIGRVSFCSKCQLGCPAKGSICT